MLNRLILFIIIVTCGNYISASPACTPEFKAIGMSENYIDSMLNVVIDMIRCQQLKTAAKKMAFIRKTVSGVSLDEDVEIKIIKTEGLLAYYLMDYERAIKYLKITFQHSKKANELDIESARVLFLSYVADNSKTNNCTHALNVAHDLLFYYSEHKDTTEMLKQYSTIGSLLLSMDSVELGYKTLIAVERMSKRVDDNNRLSIALSQSRLWQIEESVKTLNTIRFDSLDYTGKLQYYTQLIENYYLLNSICDAERALKEFNEWSREISYSLMYTLSPRRRESFWCKMQKTIIRINGLSLSRFYKSQSILREIVNASLFVKNCDLLLSKNYVEKVPSYKDFISLISNYDNVRCGLKEKEVAIDFFPCYKLRINKDNSVYDNIRYAALIMHPDVDSIASIVLCPKYYIDSLFVKFNMTKDPGEVNYTYTKDIYLHKWIWRPIDVLLSECQTVYYSGIWGLNFLNLSELPTERGKIGDLQRLVRLTSLSRINSSQKPVECLNILTYGGIRYDITPDMMAIQSGKYKPARVDNIHRGQIDRGKWNYLPGTLNEIEEIGSLMKQKGIKTEQLFGERASEESFYSISGNSPSILHIATHGFYLPTSEQQSSNSFLRTVIKDRSEDEITMLSSGLLMSGANNVWSGVAEIPEGVEDGILTAYEISQLDLRKTDLVVLSACQTGFGNADMVEGVHGIQRAFKLAGVNSIVISLWNIPDEATALLMRFFYSNLIRGIDRRESLRKAQEEIKKQYKEPYYWAGFVILD